MRHPLSRLALPLLVLPLAASAAAQRVLYSTDFDDAQGWSLVNSSPWGGNTVVWGVDALPANQLAPFVSAPASLNFNDDISGLPWGHWSGHAVSPVVDLASAVGPVRLSFEYGFVHEVDCSWDAFSVAVVDAADPTIVRFTTCLSATSYALFHWRRFELALDPAWGAVRVRFTHDTIDDWNGNEQGSFVDDLRVIEECGATLHCEGLPLSSGAPGADLTIAGTTSITAHDLRLVGAGFPTHTFAAAFAGPDTGLIPIGAGVRCVGVGTSVRLGVAPTRDQGAPEWSLDLGAAPLAQLAAVGQPLYVQTIFRDGTTLNLSDALRLALCP